MLTVENVISKSLFAVNGNVHLHESASTQDLPAAPPVNIVQRDQNVYVHFVWQQVAGSAKCCLPAAAGKPAFTSSRWAPAR
ncbi:MAG: hypothetical protein H6559_34170 [Lewinellaceae bacterium]|nr:hypothetical protein [Lewinellaceae bacterium]